MTSPVSGSSAVPRGVWILGFVSMLMDMSSEMIHSLLPIFMVTSLGASVFVVGMVEGVAEATAMIVKVFSGALSDYLRRRKTLTVLGYGLGALSKPVFAMACSLSWVFAARVVDRVGKGIRGAPRDALVADLTPAATRGAAYGLRQSLDTIGAFVGPLVAIGLMILFAGDFRTVFWFAAIPAFLAVALLMVGVSEPRASAQPAGSRVLIHWRSLARLDQAYWWVVAVGSLLTLARFSEAFLILRAQENGLPSAYAPAVLVVMNVAYALSAYPTGRIADRMSHRGLLAAGIAVLVVADIVLAQAQALGLIAVGVVLWGLHMGMTQGLLVAMVANTAPAELRGTSFGLFNLVSGIAMLIASALAGLLWEMAGATATFYGGAVVSAAALLMLMSRFRAA